MKLWRAIYHSPQEGTLYAWATSQRGAEAAWRTLRDERGEKRDGNTMNVEAVTIEPTGTGLVDWLNINFHG